MATDRKTRLQEFVAWSTAHITGDEKGEAQILLDRLLQAFSQKGVLETGKAEFRIRKPKEDGGGTTPHAQLPHHQRLHPPRQTLRSAKAGGQKSLLKLAARSAMFDPAIVHLLFDNSDESRQPSALGCQPRNEEASHQLE